MAHRLDSRRRQHAALPTALSVACRAARAGDGRRGRRRAPLQLFTCAAAFQGRALSRRRRLAGLARPPAPGLGHPADPMLVLNEVGSLAFSPQTPFIAFHALLVLAAANDPAAIRAINVPGPPTPADHVAPDRRGPDRVDGGGAARRARLSPGIARRACLDRRQSRATDVVRTAWPQCFNLVRRAKRRGRCRGIAPHPDRR